MSTFRIFHGVHFSDICVLNLVCHIVAQDLLQYSCNPKMGFLMQIKTTKPTISAFHRTWIELKIYHYKQSSFSET